MEELRRNALVWDDFCRMSELMKQKSRVLPDGVLTITCVLGSVVPSAARDSSSLLAKISKLEKDSSSLLANISKLEKANDLLSRKVNVLKEQRKTYEEQIPKLEKVINKLDSDIKNYKSLIDNLERKLSYEKDYIEELQAKSSINCKLEKDYHDCKAQIDKLQEDYQTLQREKTKLDEEKIYFEIEFKKLKDFAPFRNQDIVEKENKISGLERVHLKCEDSPSRSVSTQDLIKIPRDISTLSCDFTDLYADEVCPNFVLKCKEWSIPVNTFVLSVRSKVFRDMFQNMVQENEIGSAEIKDLEVPVMMLMLKFLYCGRLEEVSEDNVADLYDAGDKYACSLKVACCNWMERNLTKENCTTFLSIADFHSDEDLRATVVSFIIRNPEVMKTTAWQTYSNEHPKSAINVMHAFLFQ